MQEEKQAHSHMCVLGRGKDWEGRGGRRKRPFIPGIQKVNSLSFPGQIEAQGVKKRAGEFQRGAQEPGGATWGQRMAGEGRV